jgi:spore maturation protein CgeB
MKFVIFGLTISSSWGNGHATLWRALCRALVRRGHQVTFFERDVPYYASHRDLTELAGGAIQLYASWPDIRPSAQRELSDADVAIVTSYCPDAMGASDLVLSSRAKVRAFYDLDTPVTLDRLRSGEPVPYIPPGGLANFDLVLSYTGGGALHELQCQLRARLVLPLYGSVDPEVHRPAAPVNWYRADLSYLGTYAEDRQAALNELFLEPARRLSHKRFLIGGAQYPVGFPWSENIYFAWHVPPPDHAAFFSSSALTLNVTRRAMAQMGYCPSGRLFEAAACGTPIISDEWQGLDDFFAPGSEILVARTAEDAIGAMQLPAERLAAISRAARERALAEHTSDCRAIDLENAVERAARHPEPVAVSMPAEKAARTLLEV